MTTSLILACVWGLVANLIGMLPSKRNHWPAAWVLIAVGIPLLGYVTYQHGPWIAMIVAAAGVSILRWPVWYGLKWLGRRLHLRSE